MKRYKFLREVKGKIKSDSGNLTWQIGKQKTHRGQLDLCRSGLHCSKEIQQAFSFVQGEILAIVECEGKHLEKSDKEVWQKMTILKAYKWQKADSVALSIYVAELVISNYEKEYPNDSRLRDAIEAAKKWLKNPTKDNQEAAWSAARSAESAAWSAAESAAESAAWSAARSAAWSAESAKSAICKKIEAFMVKRLKKLEEIKESK